MQVGGLGFLSAPLEYQGLTERHPKAAIVCSPRFISLRSFVEKCKELPLVEAVLRTSHLLLVFHELPHKLARTLRSRELWKHLQSGTVGPKIQTVNEALAGNCGPQIVESIKALEKKKRHPGGNSLARFFLPKAKLDIPQLV